MNNEHFTLKDLENIESKIKEIQYEEFVTTIVPKLIKQVRSYIFYNQELQSLDTMQNLNIERLNKEVSSLRESLFLLEQQHKLMLVKNLD